VSSRSRLRSIVAAALVGWLAVGCAERPLPPPVSLPAPENVPTQSLGFVVDSALADKGWTVLHRKPGHTRAAVISRGSGESATIDVDYRGGSIDIRCLKRTVSDERYDRWIRLLSTIIQRKLATVAITTPPGPPIRSSSPSEEGE
jgi:hypothetical protein